MAGIPLYFIAGFLGSGKTTVLNKLLATLGNRTAGLIINEFGSIGVDAGRIEEEGRKKGDIFELNNGQIFCSCLAGPLSSALVQLAEKKPDLIIAECSGLSKPATLKDLSAGVEKATSGAIHFGGLITVVDAPRLPVLHESVQVISEQIRYAGAVVLNKIDQCSEAQILEAETLIHAANDSVQIRNTSFGDVSFSEIETMIGQAPETPDLDSSYMGWGDAGRPKNYLISPDQPLSETVLKEFLVRTAGESYRVKGAVPASEGGYYQIDCVGDSVSLEKLDQRPDSVGIVIIVPGNGKGEEHFRTLFSSCLLSEVS